MDLPKSIKELGMGPLKLFTAHERPVHGATAAHSDPSHCSQATFRG